MLFKPAGAVTAPTSIGNYNGEPVSAFGGMGMGGVRGMPGGGANVEFIAKRGKSDTPSKGAAEKWLIQDGDNEIRPEF